MSLKHLIKRILLEYTEEETVISKKDDKRITFVYKKLNELFDSLIFERVPNNNIFYFKWFNRDGKVMFERNTWGTFWVEPNGCDDFKKLYAYQKGLGYTREDFDELIVSYLNNRYESIFKDRLIVNIASEHCEGFYEVSEESLQEGVDKPKYPSLKDIKRFLKYNSTSHVKYPVISAYIVGSEARGAAKKDSDLDVAVIIPKSNRITSLQRTENYHSKFTSEAQKPKWNGRIIDIQFFYEDDPELETYSKIELN